MRDLVLSQLYYLLIYYLDLVIKTFVIYATQYTSSLITIPVYVSIIIAITVISLLLIYFTDMVMGFITVICIAIWFLYILILHVYY